MLIFNCKTRKWQEADIQELSAEELKALEDAIEAAVQEQMAEEAKRPLTMEEVVRLTIAKTINAITIEDETALRMVEFYPEWNCLIGQTVDKADYKFQHNGKLYKTIPANHTFQKDWVPGVGTESIYTRIDETHDGTMEDPIPYDGNMELTAGLYYLQDDAIYLCTRDTIKPVYNSLAELVGIYVEIA